MEVFFIRFFGFFAETLEIKEGFYINCRIINIMGYCKQEAKYMKNRYYPNSEIFTISNYEILETISDNDKNVVYRCKDILSWEIVVLKVLKYEFSTHEEVMRFKREYEILAELSESIEGVIKPLKLEEQHGIWIMVLENIQGQSLKMIMAGERPELNTLLRLVVKTVDIIGAIHEKNVIHRDIMPSNIVWNKETDAVKIIGFDLAVKLPKEKQEFENRGLLEGRGLYISPEQTGRRTRKVDYRTDFYSLGVVLYEMTTGVKPYESEDMLEQIYSIIAREAVPPFKLTGGRVSKPLSDMIMKLMEKSPENRYRSTCGIKADLQKCLLGIEDFEIGGEDEFNELYSECGYLTHNTEAAGKACAILPENTHDSFEAARIYEMQANHYTCLGMIKQSMEAGKNGLKNLGINIPDKVGTASVLLELAKVRRNLKGKTIEEVFEVPELKDEKIRLIMRLLINFIPTAYLSGETTLFALTVLKNVNLTLKHGICAESGAAFTGYSILLSGLGDINAAFDFGRLGIRLNDKFNDLQRRGLVYASYALFCHGWKEPWDTLQAWFKKAIDASLKAGNLLYLAHSCYYVNLWNPTMDIGTNLQESSKYIAMIENTGDKEALATARLARQRLLKLAGESECRFSFDGEAFGEEDYINQLQSAKYYSGIAIYYVYKTELLFIYENYKNTPQYIEKAYRIIGTLAGSVFMEEFSLYSFLSLAYCYKGLNMHEKIKARSRMRKEYRRIKKWAKNCPENFRQHELLMKAEWARISGKNEMADKYYDRAIETSEKGNFIRYKALTNELGAKFYYDRGMKELAASLFRQAVYYYSVWGAWGKVGHLEKSYPDMVRKINKLEHSEERYRQLADNMLDGIFIIEDKKYQYVNAAMAQMVGYRVEDMLGRPFEDFIHPKDRKRIMAYQLNRSHNEEAPNEYEVRLLHRNREKEVTVIQKVTVVNHLDRPAVHGTVKDISERKKAEEELRKHKEHLEELVAERTRELEYNNEELNKYIKLIEEISITDELTGLYNRRYFNDIFRREVNRAARDKGYLTFIMIDIDYYKKYNDTYGHYEGDNVLRKLGEVLRKHAKRASDYAFRLGGEEFGIVASGLDSRQSFEFAGGIRKSVEALKIEHETSAAGKYLTVSVGVAVVRVEGMNEEDVYKMADDALYNAKANGRNRVTLLEK